MRTRVGLWARTIMALALAGHLGVAGRALAVGPWERWTSDPLVSSQPRTPLQAYRDVQIEANFWRKSGSSCTEPAETACTNPNSCFKGFAFWDGDSANPGRFLVRSAFPNGTWCWKTCLLPKTRPNPNGPSICTVDAGLNRGGEVALTTTPSVPSPLYGIGFLKAPLNLHNLTAWNGQTPFQWLGDTAWSAPINYSSNRNLWRNYVQRRATTFTGRSVTDGTGFTNVLVAPAVQTYSAPPPGGFRGFIAVGSCGGSPQVIPASCHYWDSAYWRDFDDLVKVANDAGLVVVVADVMDPLNRGGSNQRLNPAVAFPARADATVFARNLASRLAGSFVVFSPSFDVKPSDGTSEPNVTVPDLINVVAQAIHGAAPRHLIGVHLAGGSPLGSYDQFQDASKPWFNLQIFQSGHGGGTCDNGVGNDYAQFACRARTFALRFRCIGEPATINGCLNSGAPSNKPIKPAVNVEGQYETLNDNESRVQTRHTAWNTGLSGSFGFNIGLAPDITAWTTPANYSSLQHNSDNDLGRMKGLFKAMPWSGLVPRTDLLIERNDYPVAVNDSRCFGTGPFSGVSAKADWLQLWKPHLAFDGSQTYGLAYLPRPATCQLSPNRGTYRASTSLIIDTASSGSIPMTCDTWSGQWVFPGDPAAGTASGFADSPALCSPQTGGRIAFSVPANKVTCGQDCDRVLVLTKRLPASTNSPNILDGGSVLDLEVSLRLSGDGLSSAILGQVYRNGLPLGEPIALSGPDLLFRKLPSVALDAAGNFLVAWEEEDGTGTDDVVGGRFNSRGEPLGTPFLLNDTTEGQQAEPWVSGDDSGNTVAVWTSYSEDDEIAGDIYGKLLDSAGQPLAVEFLISSDNLGNQSMPQVQMDGDGGFVVAWTEEPVASDPGTLPAAGAESFAAESTKAYGPARRGGVYYRVFDAVGRAHGPERRVASGNPGQDRLTRLEVHRHGGFKVRWRSTSASGQNLGESEEECDRNGNPSGGH